MPGCNGHQFPGAYLFCCSYVSSFHVSLSNGGHRFAHVLHSRSRSLYKGW